MKSLSILYLYPPIKLSECLFLLIIFTIGCKNQNNEDTASNSSETKKELTHEELMETIEVKEHDVKTIGILVYNGVNDLDALGPRYVFKNIMGAKVMNVALRQKTIKSVMGLEFQADTLMKEVDDLDILVIPGGFQETIENSYNEDLLRWIRGIDKTTKYTTSVCTGGWILGKTGLLKGKKATGNWFRAAEILAESGAEFTGERYTQDGKYWTSAGVTAGMDMSLAILKELTGHDYAQAVMLDMEYDPAPPIIGGSVENTDPKVLQFMTSMYETMSNPIFEAMENKNSPVMGYGNRKNIMEGDLTATVNLDSILKNENAYALGPVSGLKGEITVYDGTVYVSKIENNTEIIKNSKDTEAIFLLTAHQEKWDTLYTEKEIKGLKNIEAHVEKVFEAKKIDVEKATVFRIETKVPFLEYHVINKSDDEIHNHAAHQRAKQKFTLQNEKVNMVGFWVNKNQMGKFTHDGMRTHLHVISNDGHHSGHVDDVILPKGSKILTPKRD